MSISEEAKAMAARNRARLMEQQGQQRNLGELVDPEVAGRLNQQSEAALLAERLVQGNAKPVAAREKSAIAGLYDFASALDAAVDAFSKSAEVFDERSNAFIGRVRAVRMTITSEIETTLKSLKDAAAFIRLLDDQKAFALVSSLVAVGKDCKEAFGPDGLSKLAETLLVLSERRRPDSA